MLTRTHTEAAVILVLFASGAARNLRLSNNEVMFRMEMLQEPHAAIEVNEADKPWIPIIIWLGNPSQLRIVRTRLIAEQYKSVKLSRTKPTVGCKHATCTSDTFSNKPLTRCRFKEKNTSFKAWKISFAHTKAMTIASIYSWRQECRCLQLCKATPDMQCPASSLERMHCLSHGAQWSISLVLVIQLQWFIQGIQFLTLIYLFSWLFTCCS